MEAFKEGRSGYQKQKYFRRLTYKENFSRILVLVFVYTMATNFTGNRPARKKCCQNDSPSPRNFSVLHYVETNTLQNEFQMFEAMWPQEITTTAKTIRLVAT